MSDYASYVLRFGLALALIVGCVVFLAMEGMKCF